MDRYISSRSKVTSTLVERVGTSTFYRSTIGTFGGTKLQIA